MQHDDDQQLIQKCLDGQTDAFGELVTRYQDRLYHSIMMMVRSPEDARDLAQEAFIRAFNAIGTYKTSYKFSNWILKIANNHTIDYLRKRKLDTVSIDGSPHARSADEIAQSQLVIESRDESPHEYVEHRELGGQIEGAIAELREEYRTVVVLRHVEGYAYDEIADIMELPLGTVKTYLHRARGELRKSLAHLSS